MFASWSDGAPAPVFPPLDETRLDRVVEDVLHRVLEVTLVVDDPRREALTEQGSLALEAGVVLSRVVALVPLSGFGQVLDAAGEDGVVVRAQQAVAMELEVEAARGLLQEGQEHVPILVVDEEHRLVDGVRGDVEETVGQLGAKNARHSENVRPRLLGGFHPTRSGTHPTRLCEPRGVSDTRHEECQTLVVAAGDVLWRSSAGEEGYSARRSTRP
jgi:hypothetical protein